MKTKPFEHQLEEYNRSKDMKTRGIFWEQGLGKSKLVIDTYVNLLNKYLVDSMFILAPNGVHANWVLDELPTHMDMDKTECLIWDSQKSKGVKWKEMAANFMKPSLYKNLVLVMSYDALMTDRGVKFAKEFLLTHKVFFILDESTKIKTPGSKRTKRVNALSKYAEYKRILTGTPISNSPFDIYSQIKFLDLDFWKKKFCLANATLFKARYGEFDTNFRKVGGQLKEYQTVIGYKNMSELKQVMAEIGDRREKEECLDLPEKLYSKRYFKLTPAQRRAYAELQADFITTLENGEEVTAQLAIVRLTRFQQIVCGYLPISDDDPTLRQFAGKNPRIECLLELCEEIDTKTIIWARYTKDVDLICEALGEQAIFVDGRVTGDDRTNALNKFKKDPSLKFLVAKASAIGMGFTITEAKTAIYYSNTFKLDDRLQSEDRNHRIGQTTNVNYYDIICEDVPIDKKMIDALLKKRSISTEILNDKIRSWIA